MLKKKWIFQSFVVLLAIVSSACWRGNEKVKASRDLDPLFCSQWNPDFKYNKNLCCARMNKGKPKRCTPVRKSTDFCKEMTPEQIEYTFLVETGQYPDVLSYLQKRNSSSEQAFCTVNTGFLAHGRRVIPTSQNRLQLFFPGRCTNFGTDAMAGMLEWLGREVSKEYSKPAFQGVKLLIGDIAAPRGGCIWGLSGKTAHRSHTNGQDVDLGFLTVTKHKNSPITFHRVFDAKANWWLIKKIFKNPFACVKMVLLEKRLIQSLQKVAKKDPEWKNIRHFLIHAPGHSNHMHIRIGNGPGKLGCFGSDPLGELIHDVSEEGSD